MIKEDFTLFPKEYEDFKKKFLEISGIDLNFYKHQIHRRVHMFMKRWNIGNYEELFKLIKTDKEKYKSFVDYLTINVSEFFRNPERFEILEKEIIPLTMKPDKSIKIWSAGCSTGEEPYSLAIILEDLKMKKTPRILATDIDPNALEKAKQGIYDIKQLQNVNPERLKNYFIKKGENLYEVNNNIKERVEFKRHDLLNDPFDKDFDLILCRNVVIYFEKEIKDKLYQKFRDALRIGGVLMVGNTEQIFGYREIGFKSIKPFFYQRIK
ncbi:MAG: protein-glutamate O-methyltransferase CheR [Synergistetes bacterium]|nr:protein-glutamate O-methyltransferase CheR [Synergistota bacterium]MCX8127999.1 protein-glutamate O-methyltransferase CheR [Synergistota bacterium]MDW8192806.1 protein-glutamate O-methyltransferase CheR [Synergistota bacterium]